MLDNAEVTTTGSDIAELFPIFVVIKREAGWPLARKRDLKYILHSADLSGIGLPDMADCTVSSPGGPGLVSSTAPGTAARISRTSRPAAAWSGLPRKLLPYDCMFHGISSPVLDCDPDGRGRGLGHTLGQTRALGGGAHVRQVRHAAGRQVRLEGRGAGQCGAGQSIVKKLTSVNIE